MLNYLHAASLLSGCGATVAHQLPKLRVAGSNPVARSNMNYAPTQHPNLPFPLTGVWIMPQTARKRVRWDGIAWHLHYYHGATLLGVASRYNVPS